MQKLYLTKCTIIMLLTASIQNFGMTNRRKITRKPDQEAEINLYIREISKDNYEKADAILQEKQILWYTKTSSEQMFNKIKPEYAKENNSCKNHTKHTC